MSTAGATRTYWYKNFIEACPVCGRTRRWRERQYSDPPPKHDVSRWDYYEVYDWCDV